MKITLTEFGRKVLKKSLYTYMNYHNKFLKRVGIDVFFLCYKEKTKMLVYRFKGFKSDGATFIPPEIVKRNT